jgi:hypothetical protein
MIKEYRHEIFLTIVAFLAFSVASRWEGLSPFIGGFIHHLTIILLAIALGFAFALYAIRKDISTLLEQHRSANQNVRRPLALFMRHRLEALQRVRSDLTSSNGLDLDESELERFVDSCFSANDGKSYVGTDSNVPTRFYELYPTYLGKQFSEDRLQHPGYDARILFTSEDELRTDYQSNKVMFTDFYENHWSKHVRLLQVDKATAAQLAKNQHLSSTDLGIFGGTFVAFFTPYKNGTVVRYRIQLEALTPERRQQLQQYMHMLNRYAKEIRLQNNLVECVDRDSAKVEADEQRFVWALTRSLWKRSIRLRAP